MEKNEEQEIRQNEETALKKDEILKIQHFGNLTSIPMPMEMLISRRALFQIILQRG